MNQTDELMIRLGYDAKAVEVGTQRLLEKQGKAAIDMMRLWNNAVRRGAEDQLKIEREKQAQLTAIEKQGHDARVAAYQAAEAKRIAIGKANHENTLRQRAAHQQAMGEIAGGSGGYGWRTDKNGKPIAGSGMAGQVGSSAIVGAAQDVASGGTLKAAATGAAVGVGLAAATIKLGKWIDALISGENITKGLKGVSSALKKMGVFISENIAALSKTFNALSVAYYGAKTIVTAAQANEAHMQETISASAAAMQAGHIRGSNEDRIDEMQKSGAISPAQAGRLRSMMGGSSDQMRAAQRFLIVAQAKEEAAAAERKAKAEGAAAAAVSYAERAAAGKAHYEREAAAALSQQTRINNEIASLQDQAHDLRSRGMNIDVERPTIAMLAGRDAAARINAQFGPGGQYDMEAGNGPFAAAAQAALYYKNAQMALSIQGQGQWDKEGHLVGGAAYEARRRRISAENMLSQAGIETPEMQFTAIREQLQSIGKNIATLALSATQTGLKLADDQ